MANSNNSTRQKRTHGQTGTSEYNIWAGMKARCLNPKDHAFPKYGGRGITVDPRWLKFENFFADMGPRPSKAHSLERVNNDLGYTRTNCKWATRREQNSNMRTNVRITYKGVTQTLQQWSDQLNVSHHTLRWRLRTWDKDRAMNAPARHRHRPDRPCLRCPAPPVEG